MKHVASRLVWVVLPIVTSIFVAVGQDKFKFDPDNDRYWDGTAWKDVGDDRYEETISSYEPALSKFESGRTIKTFGLVLAGAGGFSLGWGLWIDQFRHDRDKRSTRVFYIVGAALVIPGIILWITGNNAITQSGVLYDEHINSPSESSLLNKLRITPSYDMEHKAITIRLTFRTGL